MPLGTMTKNKQTIKYILELAKKYNCLTSDRILLGSNGIPTELKSIVALQVEINKKIKNKLPSWADYKTFIPSRINLEQSSSEVVAKYKQHYIKDTDILLDLTSGLGVDLFYLSQKTKRGIYVEKDIDLFQASKYNFEVLLGEKIDKIKFYTNDFNLIIQEVINKHRPTIIYIDPARRTAYDKDKRVYAIEDCEPNIIDAISKIESIYREYGIFCPRYLIKLSPMLNIKDTYTKIKNIESIEILANKGEVKEILLLINSVKQPFNTKIISTNILVDNTVSSFYSSFLEEKQSSSIYISHPLSYIYEPNAAVMKSSLFKSIANRFNIYPISTNSHLFTSMDFIPNFCGRTMRLIEVIQYSNKYIKKIKQNYPKAQIRTRDFPLSSEELRKKLGTDDSETIRIIGTKDNKGSKLLLVCELIK